MKNNANINTEINVTIHQGPSGSGKSTLLKELWSKDPSHTLCLAPTGIAAERLRDEGCPALTIHATFNLPPVAIPVFKESDYRKNKELLDSLNQILIDEMSMISCALMDWILSLLNASAVNGHHIYLHLFGDVMQLPPVFKVPKRIETLIKPSFMGKIDSFSTQLVSILSIQRYISWRKTIAKETANLLMPCLDSDSEMRQRTISSC